MLWEIYFACNFTLLLVAFCIGDIEFSDLRCKDGILYLCSYVLFGIVALIAGIIIKVYETLVSSQAYLKFRYPKQYEQALQDINHIRKLDEKCGNAYKQVNGLFINDIKAIDIINDGGIKLYIHLFDYGDGYEDWIYENYNGKTDIIIGW